MFRQRRGFSVGKRQGGAMTLLRSLPAGGKAIYKRVLNNPRLKRKLKTATRTLTRQMPVFKNVKVDGQGGQISSYKVSNKPNKVVAIMKKSNNSNYLYWNQPARMVCTPGVQIVYQIPFFSGGGYSTSETLNNDLATIQYKITGTIAANTPSRTVKYVAESCVGKTLFTNQDQGNVELHLYDIVCRRDTPNDPLGAWVNGLNDQNGGATFAYNSLPLGSVPQASEYFNVYYKVKQHTRVVLAQGQSHCHYVSIKPNRMFNAEILESADISYKGWTVWTLIVANGLPANDVTTVSSVSSGQVNLDVVATKQLRYTYSVDAVQNYYYTQSLPTSFAVGQSVMDIGSGAKVTDTPA